MDLKAADPQSIQALCDRIVRDFRPLKVILFGSYAPDGAPTADSDVDLLVVLPFEGNPVLERRLALQDFFYREIMEKGQVLYDAARADSAWAS